LFVSSIIAATSADSTVMAQVDSIPLDERLDFFRQFANRSSYAEQQLFPPLARQLSSSAGNSSSSAQNSSNVARHSFGGGSAGGGDNSRSVRYQDGVQRMSHNSRQQDRYEYDEEFEDLMNFASHSNLERRGSGQQSGQKRGRNDRYTAPPSPPHSSSNYNNRRHSFPLTNNNQQRSGAQHSSVLDPAFQHRMESRKRRFHD
jgi:hypothetical protein